MTGITYETGMLEALRQAIGQWTTRNFGNTRLSTTHGTLRSSAGICEELGEMQDALENCEGELVFDSVADICIYALDLMWGEALTVQDVLLHDKDPSKQERDAIEDATASISTKPQFYDSVCDQLMRGLVIQVGRLCHHTLKQDQHIRKGEDHKEGIKLRLCHIFRLLYRFCAHFNQDLNVLIKDMASNVLKRDWVKSPDNAHKEVP